MKKPIDITVYQRCIKASQEAEAVVNLIEALLTENSSLKDEIERLNNQRLKLAQNA